MDLGLSINSGHNALFFICRERAKVSHVVGNVFVAFYLIP